VTYREIYLAALMEGYNLMVGIRHIFLLVIISMSLSLCIPAFGQTTVEEFIGQGTAFYSQGKYDEAIKAFDMAVELIKQAKDLPSKLKMSKLDNTVKIIGIDPTDFSRIRVSLLINKSCALGGSLKKGDFKIEEDGKSVSIDNFYFSGNDSNQKLDLAVVFDITGSMSEEISAMKSKVQGLTNQLKGAGIDTRYELVTFADRYSVKTNWTGDPSVFKSSVNSLQAIGGDDEPEVSLDAISHVLSMGFRSDAQKVILVITDAHAHYKNDGSSFSNSTKEEIEKDLRDAGVIFIPISPTFTKSSSYEDLREVANDIQSMWIDINSADFSTILDQFQGILTGTYVIEYTSPDQTQTESRIAKVSVSAPGCVDGYDSNSYNKPGKSFTVPNFGNIIVTPPLDAGHIKENTAADIDKGVNDKQILVTVGKGFFIDNLEAQYLEAPPGKSYLVLPVQFENIGYDSLEYNPFYCKVAIDNVQYNGALLGVYFEQEGYSSLDNVVTLKDGGKIKGYLEFEVPKETTNYDFVFEPISISKYNIVYVKGDVSP
jgi:hypothetical protein